MKAPNKPVPNKNIEAGCKEPYNNTEQKMFEYFVFHWFKLSYGFIIRDSALLINAINIFVLRVSS